MIEFTEKRRYFRVEDELEMTYRVLQADEKISRLVKVQQDYSQSYAELENQIQTVCQKIAKKLPDVAELCRLLNRKIDIVAKGPLDSEPECSADVAFHSVNISACGIAFLVQEHLPLGAQLLLRAKLKPANHEVTLAAFVIACEPVSAEANDTSYILRADFSGISEDLRELLIQHVMQVQGHLLRQRRHSR